MSTRLPIGASAFPADYRASGVLLHVTSLPTRHGIGDLGPSARAWIDCLHDAGQSWWQALPLGPTGYRDSPYQALSSFAGNGLLISPDALVEEGVFETRDFPDRSPPDDAVDYGAVIAFKHGLLDLLWSRFNARRPDLRDAFDKFCQANSPWLEDYALFRALKAAHSNVHYLQWPAALLHRETDALARARCELAGLIEAIRLSQFLLFRQAKRLKEYARSKGVRLIGDLPFFVSPGSSDLWAHPELFLLDRQGRPTSVAGVPPDAFSAHGQLWGNPVYNWDVLRQTGYRWCIDRLCAALAHVDVLRLDHFRAFAAAWHVPAGAPTAQSGQWVAGPGADFFHAVERELGSLPFIAEDLGIITPDVKALMDQFHLPGNRVLQFGFDGDMNNPHLPRNIRFNNVVYTGTHDNPTTREWFEQLLPTQRRLVANQLIRSGAGSGEIAWELINAAWSSPAALAIAPLQDLLNLGGEARMNRPGRAEGNWRWRCSGEMIPQAVRERLRELTQSTNRLIQATAGVTTNA